MNIRHLRALQAASLLTRPHQHGALTRRQFLKAGATAAAVAVGSSLGHPQAVWADSDHKSPRDPRPIPYGTPFLFPDPTIFHVQAPGYPLPNPPFDTNPATNDPATITDFNGFVGLAYVGGQGTHHDLVTDQTASLYWEVDMRFMVGEYVGQDGRHHHATFGFV
jgi:TAT (twin-arginine translocation) pathway signal sequence